MPYSLLARCPRSGQFVAVGMTWDAVNVLPGLRR